MTQSLLAFVDVETTGLGMEHEIWEVGLILRRSPDPVSRLETTYHWFLPVDLGRADPVALKIGRFYERHPDFNLGRTDLPDVTPLKAFAREFSMITRDHYLVGAVPSFDSARLAQLLRANGACPLWLHRLICVETLAMAATGVLPEGLTKTAERLGIVVPEEDRHTALGDCRVAMAVYDKVLSD